MIGHEPAAHHLLWIDALQAVDDGRIRKLLVISPPGSAKSTVVSLAFPSWYLARHPNRHVITATMADTLAKGYLGSVRATFEKPEFRTVFPEVSPDPVRGWSQAGLHLRGPEPRPVADKDPSYVAVGVDSAIIGRRADGVIVDDVVDEATARSDVLLEARKVWLARTVMSRLRPGGWRIVVGTRWSDDDIVSAAEDSEQYVVIRMKALSETHIVTADVEIPDDVSWRPSLAWHEVA